MFGHRFLRIGLPLMALGAGAMFLIGCRGRFCSWKCSPEDKADYVVKKLSKELNLSGDQRVKLDRIKTDLMARKADFQSLHAGLRDELLSQLRASKVDPEKLNQSLDSREAKMKELRGFLVGEFAQLHDMLDSTQREKLAGYVQGMGGGRCGGHGCCR